VLKIGNCLIGECFDLDVKLPTAWNSDLDALFGEVSSLAHKMCKVFFRIQEVSLAKEKNLAYGRYTVQVPNGEGIACALPAKLSIFDDAILKANLLYIYMVNEAALAALNQTLKDLLGQLKQLFDLTLKKRTDQFAQLLAQAIPHLVPMQPMQVFWTSSCALFRCFLPELSRFVDKYKANFLEKIVKKAKATELIKNTQDDLMDIEMSAQTIRAVIDQRVTELLQSKDSIGPKSGTAKQKPASAKPPKPKPGNVAKKPDNSTSKPEMGNSSRGKSPGSRPMTNAKTTKAPRSRSSSKNRKAKTLSAPKGKTKTGSAVSFAK
jgi:hypothetical protein